MPKRSSRSLSRSLVPGTQSIFILGCLEGELGQRVTVYSQQVRALNLAADIVRHELVAPKSKVAVVGGGISAVTVAGALALGIDRVSIRLYERRDRLIHLQMQSPNRYVHPHIYDWPAANSLNDNADLPIFSWKAGAAGDVATQCIDQFNMIAAQRGIEVRCGVEVSAVESLPHEGAKVTSSLFPHGQIYDVVIIAVGFGYEKELEGENESYWTSSRLVGSLRKPSKNQLIFVSGNGDGGLVDFAMASFNGYDHITLCKAIVSTPNLKPVENAIRKIDATARIDPEIDILAEYNRVLPPLLPKGMVLRFGELLRPDVRIIFHTAQERLFRVNTSALNRFIAWLAIVVDRNRGSGAIEIQTGFRLESWNKGHVQLAGRNSLAPQLILLRYGADTKANLKPFKSLVDALLGSLLRLSFGEARDEHLNPATRALFETRRAILPPEAVAKPRRHTDGHESLPTLQSRSSDHRLVAVLNATPAFKARARAFLRFYAAGSSDIPIFVGRIVEKEVLTQWLDDPATQRCLIKAPAGRGKSSLLVQWLHQERTHWEIIFIPISLRFGTSRLLDWGEALYRALAGTLPEPFDSEPPLSESHFITLAHELLDKRRNNQPSLLLVIDGIDESTNRDALAYLFPTNLPRSIKIIAAARETASATGSGSFDWIALLCWQSRATATFTLDPMSPSDVLAAVNDKLLTLERLERLTASVRIWEVCDKGEPLLINLFMQDLERKPDLLEQMVLNSKPWFMPGYAGLIARWIDDQIVLVVGHIPISETDVRRVLPSVLLLLANARSGLTASDIATLLRIGYEISLLPLSRLISVLDRLVIATDQGYVLCHSKIAQYVMSPDFADELSRAAARRAYSEWCGGLARQLLSVVDARNEISLYQIHWAVEHLLEAAPQFEQLSGFVTSCWQRRKRTVEGNDFGFGRSTHLIRDYLLTNIENETLGQRQVALSLAFRCTLVLSSIRNSTHRVPPELLAQCLSHRILSEYEVIQLLNNIANPTIFADAFITLEPQLSDYGLEQIIALRRFLEHRPEGYLCRLAFARRGDGPDFRAAFDVAMTFAESGKFRCQNDQIDYLEALQPFAKQLESERYYHFVVSVIKTSVLVLSKNLFRSALLSLPEGLWPTFESQVLELLIASGRYSLEYWIRAMNVVPSPVAEGWIVRLLKKSAINGEERVGLAFLSKQLVKGNADRRSQLEQWPVNAPDESTLRAAEILELVFRSCTDGDSTNLEAYFEIHPDSGRDVAAIAATFFDSRTDTLINRCIDAMDKKYHRSWSLHEVLAARPNISLPAHLDWIRHAEDQEERAEIVVALSSSHCSEVLQTCLAEIDNLGRLNIDTITVLAQNSAFGEIPSLLKSATLLRDRAEIWEHLCLVSAKFPCFPKQALSVMISRDLKVTTSQRERLFLELMIAHLQRDVTTPQQYSGALRQIIIESARKGIERDLVNLIHRLHGPNLGPLALALSEITSDPGQRSHQFLAGLDFENSDRRVACVIGLETAAGALRDEFEISHLAKTIIACGPSDILPVAVRLLDRNAQASKLPFTADNASDALIDQARGRTHDPILHAIFDAVGRLPYEFQRTDVMMRLCKRLGPPFADILITLIRSIDRPQGIAWAIRDYLDVLIPAVHDKVIALADDVGSGKTSVVDNGEFYQELIYGLVWQYSSDPDRLEKRILELSDPIARAKGLAEVRVPAAKARGAVGTELQRFLHSLKDVRDIATKCSLLGRVIMIIDEADRTPLIKELVALTSEIRRSEALGHFFRTVSDSEFFISAAEAVGVVLEMYP